MTTHKECPGIHMVKDHLVAAVVGKMQELHPGDHQDIPAHVHEADTAGMTDAELNSITWLQQQLNALGNHLDVDGVAGSATKKAVEAFQKQNGLTVDGIAGPLTGRLSRRLRRSEALVCRFDPTQACCCAAPP